MPTFASEMFLLLASAAAIYFACEFFVNGVEWLGRRLSVGSTATGTILAAIGTALPESVVTFVAVAFAHDDDQRELGIGAALGGPLALSTIAYALVGATLLLSGRRLKQAGLNDFRRLSRDQAWFLGIFTIKLAIGVIAFAWKPWLGMFFLGVYALYFWRQMTGDEEGEEEELDPLLIAGRQLSPSLGMIVLQTSAALTVIFIASSFFVHQLDVMAPALGVAPQVLALFLSPIATELPETIIAIIWVRQGKHRLALANISGAMMIQATVPTAFGVIFTPWILDHTLLVAGGVTLAAVLALWAAFRGGWVNRWFLVGIAALYGLFVLIVVQLH